MSGYSSTPLHQKLCIKPENKVSLMGDVPASFIKLIKETYPQLDIDRGISSHFDYMHIFETDKEQLENWFPWYVNHLKTDGMLWISWPKKSSKVATSLDENSIREIGLTHGVVDVKVCAIDDVWSGLKFVRRLRDRVTE